MTSEPLQLLRLRPRFDPWRLRAWRVARGMRQQDLAEAIGLPGHRGARQINRLENYVCKPSAKRLAKLADALGVEVKHLQSTQFEADAHRGLFDEWARAGRPDLSTWAEARGVK